MMVGGRQARGDDRMSAEELKVSIRLVVEGAYNRGALEALRTIYGDTVVAHRPPLPDIRGLESLTEHRRHSLSLLVRPFQDR